MNKSFYEKDSKNEQILTEWIIDNFLVDYCEKFDVVDNIDIQKSGVDFVMNSKGLFGFDLPYKVDFKAALNYIMPIKDKYGKKPTKMPTFAFELSFLNQMNKESEGWLFGDKYNNTEYYMLAWVWANLPYYYKNNFVKTKMDKFNYENIKEVEIIVVKKESIQNYARKYNINEDSSITKAKEMRNNNIKEEQLTKSKKYPKLHYTSFLQEKPVNLVIHTNDLEEMAVFHKTITKVPTKQKRIDKI